MPLLLRDPKLPHVNLDEIRCFLASRSGALIWRSAAWSAYRNHELEGERWLEFVQPDQVARVLEWFADESDRPICFNILTESHGWAECHFVKLRYGRDWLCVGDFFLLPS